MHFTDDERHARLGVRHFLAAKAATAEDVVDGILALHATDAASVYLSAAARLRTPSVTEVERALYDDRTLVRLLGMRRTVFVVRAKVAPVVQAACTDDIARKERQQLAKHLSTSGHPEPLADAERWLAEVSDAAEQALAARGAAFTQELSGDVPGLKQQLHMAKGKKYESIVNVSSRVLGILAAEGRIVRGRPRGTWLSTQYNWSTMATWLPDRVEWTADAARVELVRRWLRAFGPAPLADLKWWTGWTVGQTKKVLADVGPVEVDLDSGGTGVALPDDLEPTPEPEPWVALLPALDPTAMGWFERGWYLGPHKDALFDRNGNVGPTVWADGRIVGGWAQRRSGEVVHRLLSDVGAEAAAAVEAESARLAEWLGDVRVVPKFRTPLERELAG